MEELAERSGATVRTIRYYQSEGLLPAPGRQGREARYGAAHLSPHGGRSPTSRTGGSASPPSPSCSATPAATTASAGLAGPRPDAWSGRGARTSPCSSATAELPGAAGRDAGDHVEALVPRRAGRAADRHQPGRLPGPQPRAARRRPASCAALGIDLDTAAALRDLLEHRLRALATELVAEFTDRVSLGHLAERGPGRPDRPARRSAAGDPAHRRPGLRPRDGAGPAGPVGRRPRRDPDRGGPAP